MDRFPEKIDSKFRFVLVAANRAEQLMKGAPSKVEIRDRKSTVVALEELNNDLIAWDLGEAPAPAPVEDVVAAEPVSGDEATEASAAAN